MAEDVSETAEPTKQEDEQIQQPSEESPDDTNAAVHSKADNAAPSRDAANASKTQAHAPVESNTQAAEHDVESKPSEEQQKQQEEGDKEEHVEEEQQQQRKESSQTKHQAQAKKQEQQHDQQQDQQHQQVPVRQYLDSTVVPLLRDGLKKLVKQRPDDPIDFLINYLSEHKEEAKLAQQSKQQPQ